MYTKRIFILLSLCFQIIQSNAQITHLFFISDLGDTMEILLGKKMRIELKDHSTSYIGRVDSVFSDRIILDKKSIKVTDILSYRISGKAPILGIVIGATSLFIGTAVAVWYLSALKNISFIPPGWTFIADPAIIISGAVILHHSIKKFNSKFVLVNSFSK